MATLDATVGGANSNSYVTAARGNALMGDLPHARTWFTDLTSGASRTDLYIHATRLVDRYFRFEGRKTAKAQALEWPRRDVTDYRTGDLLSSAAIPSFVEWAVVEWAFVLFEDPSQEFESIPGVRMLRTPSYSVEYTNSGSRRVPRVVTDLLLPYGERDALRQIRLLRA